jgi:hypothetical protein
MSENSMQINLPLSADYQKRLRRFVGVMDFPSMRAFVTEAIEHYVTTRLDLLTPEQRAQVEEVLER